MYRRTLRALTIAVVVASATLAACGEADPISREASAGGDVATTTRTTTTDDPSDDVSAFGASHGFEWDSGLSVSVISARLAARSAYAAGGRATWPVVVVRVKMTNGSGERFDSDLAEVALRYGPDGETAEGVYQDGVEGLSGSIAPGRSATGSYAFSVPRADADEITVEVTPTWESEPGTFEGRAKR